MRAILAILLLASAVAAVPASAESVGHCLAQDACTSVDVGDGGACAYVGQGRGTATVACTDGRDVDVVRCEAGSGCRELL